jgi:hypothetical protein
MATKVVREKNRLPRERSGELFSSYVSLNLLQPRLTKHETSFRHQYDQARIRKADAENVCRIAAPRIIDVELARNPDKGPGNRQAPYKLNHKGKEFSDLQTPTLGFIDELW